jgi:hypothetical protein
MDYEPERNRARETVLMVSLVVLLGGTIAVTLIFVSMGVFAYVLMAVPAFALVGYLHYMLWGYSMAQQTAGEREEIALHEEEEDVTRVRRQASVQDLSRQRHHD